MGKISTLLTDAEREFIQSGSIDRRRKWRLFNNLDSRFDSIIEALEFLLTYRDKSNHPISSWILRKKLIYRSQFYNLESIFEKLVGTFEYMYLARIRVTNSKNCKKLYWLDEGNADFKRWKRPELIFNSDSALKGIKGKKIRAILLKAYEKGMIPTIEREAIPLGEIKAKLSSTEELINGIVKCSECGNDKFKSLENKRVKCVKCEKITILT